MNLKREKVSESKKVKSKLAVTCYVIAAVMLIVAVYTAVANILYIKDYASYYGMTIGDMWQDALQYFISGFVPYFAYAVIIFGVGIAMQYIFDSRAAGALKTVAAEAGMCEVAELHDDMQTQNVEVDETAVEDMSQWLEAELEKNEQTSETGEDADGEVSEADDQAADSDDENDEQQK